MKLDELMENFIQEYLDKNKIDLDDWSINQSTQKGFGDYSSNVALKLTKLLKKSPLEIAEEIAHHNNINKEVFDLSASKPGFVNFHISNKYYIGILDKILEQKKNFGKHKKNGQKGKLSQILKLLETKLENKNFFKPPEKRSAMIKNINNLFYRMEPNDKELRILGSLIGSLSKNKKKHN